MKTCIDCDTPVKGLKKRCEHHRRVRANLLSVQRHATGVAQGVMTRYMSNYDELDVKANRESLKKVKAMKKTQFSLGDFQCCPPMKMERLFAKMERFR